MIYLCPRDAEYSQSAKAIKLHCKHQVSRHAKSKWIGLLTSLCKGLVLDYKSRKCVKADESSEIPDDVKSPKSHYSIAGSSQKYCGWGISKYSCNEELEKDLRVLRPVNGRNQRAFNYHTYLLAYKSHTHYEKMVQSISKLESRLVVYLESHQMHPISCVSVTCILLAFKMSCD